MSLVKSLFRFLVLLRNLRPLHKVFCITINMKALWNQVAISSLWINIVCMLETKSLNLIYPFYYIQWVLYWRRQMCLAKTNFLLQNKLLMSCYCAHSTASFNVSATLNFTFTCYQNNHSLSIKQRHNCIYVHNNRK